MLVASASNLYDADYAGVTNGLTLGLKAKIIALGALAAPVSKLIFIAVDRDVPSWLKVVRSTTVSGYL